MLVALFARAVCWTMLAALFGLMLLSLHSHIDMVDAAALVMRRLLSYSGDDGHAEGDDDDDDDDDDDAAAPSTWPWPFTNAVRSVSTTLNLRPPVPSRPKLRRCIITRRPRRRRRNNIDDADIDDDGADEVSECEYSLRIDVGWKHRHVCGHDDDGRTTTTTGSDIKRTNASGQLAGSPMWYVLRIVGGGSDNSDGGGGGGHGGRADVDITVKIPFRQRQQRQGKVSARDDVSDDDGADPVGVTRNATLTSAAASAAASPPRRSGDSSSDCGGGVGEIVYAFAAPRPGTYTLTLQSMTRSGRLSTAARPLTVTRTAPTLLRLIDMICLAQPSFSSSSLSSSSSSSQPRRRRLRVSSHDDDADALSPASSSSTVTSTVASATSTTTSTDWQLANAWAAFAMSLTPHDSVIGLDWTSFERLMLPPPSLSSPSTSSLAVLQCASRALRLFCALPQLASVLARRRVVIDFISDVGVDAYAAMTATGAATFSGHSGSVDVAATSGSPASVRAGADGSSPCLGCAVGSSDGSVASPTTVVDTHRCHSVNAGPSSRFSSPSSFVSASSPLPSASASASASASSSLSSSSSSSPTKHHRSHHRPPTLLAPPHVVDTHDVFSNVLAALCDMLRGTDAMAVQRLLSHERGSHQLLLAFAHTHTPALELLLDVFATPTLCFNVWSAHTQRVVSAQLCYLAVFGSDSVTRLAPTHRALLRRHGHLPQSSLQQRSQSSGVGGSDVGGSGAVSPKQRRAPKSSPAASAAAERAATEPAAAAVRPSRAAARRRGNGDADKDGDDNASAGELVDDIELEQEAAATAAAAVAPKAAAEAATAAPAARRRTTRSSAAAATAR